MEKFRLKEFIVLLTLFLVIDLLWITFVASPLFGRMVKNIQGYQMVPKIVPAIFSYLLIAIGLYRFGFLNYDKNNVLKSLLWNATLYGLIVYGVFDFTNLAIFQDYKWGTAFIDIMWGGAVCTLTTFLAHTALEKIPFLKSI